MVLLSYAIDFNVELKASILALILFVVDIVCACEDDIVGDEHSTACTHLLVFVEEGEAADRTMQQFL